MLLQVFLSYKYNWCANLSETFFDIDLQELLYYSWDTEENLIFHIEIFYDAQNNISSNVQIFETLGRMGTSFGCSDLWDRLNLQALIMIGRWYF